MAQSQDNGAAERIAIAGTILQSSMSIAGIAIALDAALYILYVQNRDIYIPCLLVLAIALVAALSLGASVKAIWDLMEAGGVSRTRGVVQLNEYAFMFWATVLLILGLVLLHFVYWREFLASCVACLPAL